MERRDGFVPLYWNRGDGTLWLEIPALDTEMLYYTSLSAGLGSNDIGLDRGQLGDTHIVRFQRVGKKVLMVEPNYALPRAQRQRRRAARRRRGLRASVLWGFEVGAETDGRVLVDATTFVLRDVHDVMPQPASPATYSLDASRSAVNLDADQGVPAQHRDGRAPDVHQQRRATPARPAVACPAAA